MKDVLADGQSYLAGCGALEGPPHYCAAWAKPLLACITREFRLSTLLYGTVRQCNICSLVGTGTTMIDECTGPSGPRINNFGPFGRQDHLRSRVCQGSGSLQPR